MNTLNRQLGNRERKVKVKPKCKTKEEAGPVPLKYNLNITPHAEYPLPCHITISISPDGEHSKRLIDFTTPPPLSQILSSLFSVEFRKPHRHDRTRDKT
jgi:hypothetical protein